MAVLNKHHGNIPEDAIYIGRGSIWGNPYVIGKHGTREEVIKKYCRKINNLIANDMECGYTEFIEKLADLHGKNLVCYCAPKSCHGDILERYAEQAHILINALEKL